MKCLTRFKYDVGYELFWKSVQNQKRNVPVQTEFLSKRKNKIKIKTILSKNTVVAI